MTSEQCHCLHPDLSGRLATFSGPVESSGVFRDGLRSVGIFFSSSLWDIISVTEAYFPRLPKSLCLYRSTQHCCWGHTSVGSTSIAVLPHCLQIWLTLCYSSLTCAQETHKPKQTAHLGLVRSSQDLSFLLHVFCMLPQHTGEAKTPVFGSDVLEHAPFLCTMPLEVDNGNWCSCIHDGCLPVLP